MTLPVPTRAVSIAHRGASGHAPEHTFAAYDLALEMGADYIEQDLQMTADGVLVAMHDETLQRTAGRPGRVDEHTLAELSEIDVGSWFDPRFAGERIPTLDAILRRYGHRARYYIETKAPETADRMEERLLALLGEHGLIEPAEERRQVLIQSFSAASLHRIHDANPRLPLIQLFRGDVGSEAIRERLDDVCRYAFGIGPAKRSVDAALLAAAHERDLHVHPWTVDEPGELEALLALGADGAFSNHPDRFAEALDLVGLDLGREG